MARLILLVGIVLVMGLLLRGFLRTSPAVVARYIKTGLLGLAGILLIWLMASGRLGWLVPAIGGLVAVVVRMLPLIARLAPALHRLWTLKRSSVGGPAQANRSVVEARFVRMRLDHDTGEMSGEVLEGVFAGRQMNDLTMDEVVQLLQMCLQQDEDSAALVKAYLDRIYGEDWQASAAKGGGGHEASGSDAMTIEEACQVLGVASDASKQAIIEAHRRLIQRMHPDRGGTDYLAAKINQAKELLLSR